MQPKRIDNQRMLTGKVRLSYPNLLTPSESDLNRGKYTTSFVINETDTETLEMVQSLIKDAINTAKEGEWKGKKGRVDYERWKELDADKQVDGDKWLVRCSGSNYSIPVINPTKQPVTDPSVVYGGAYARLMLRAYTWAQAGRLGVSLLCDAVQLLGGGEPYAATGSKVSLDAFDVEEDKPLQSVGGAPSASVSVGGTAIEDLPF